MTPLTRKLVDAAIAVALTFAIVLVIVVTSSFLTTRGGYTQGFKAWLALMERSDIVGMAILTALVSTGYSIWQGGSRR
ncbi:MAG: hypothetical protein JSS20_09545 [Proteobacteria bacterium]|nr:hypothetical protein [Pseudomonadota bacterium]